MTTSRRSLKHASTNTLLGSAMSRRARQRRDRRQPWPEKEDA